jgi:hypothetical protein
VEETTDQVPSDGERRVLRVSTRFELSARKISTVTVALSPAAMPPTPLIAGVLSFVKLPAAGVTISTAGRLRSTVHVRVAESGSTLPAASIARTSKVCEPGVRLE